MDSWASHNRHSQEQQRNQVKKLQAEAGYVSMQDSQVYIPKYQTTSHVDKTMTLDEYEATIAKKPTSECTTSRMGKADDAEMLDLMNKYTVTKKKNKK